MSEMLSELLQRSADGAPDPLVDLGSLTRAAGRRQRRRRLAVAGTAATVVGLVAVSMVAVRSGIENRPEPGPSDPTVSPSQTTSPSAVEPEGGGRRPLVYATGSTVHVGDRTFDAGGNVGFLDVTDDGVLFVNEDDERLWFNDGATTHAIGQVQIGPGDFFYVPSYVSTTNPGSLVVWEDSASRTSGNVDRFVVYDTSRDEVVTRIPYVGRFDQVLRVDDNFVYFQPDPATPGCWIRDIQICDDPHLLRFDLASGSTKKISLAAFDAELSIVTRMFVQTEPDAEIGFTDGAGFTQVGRRLVPLDSDGGVKVLTRTNGEEVRLRLPSGYAAPGDEDGFLTTSQWLNDDYLVIEASNGDGDSGPTHGDLLVCRLPDGTCRIALSNADFVPAGL